MSSVKTKVNLSAFRRNKKNAQAALAEQVLNSSKNYMPKDTGSLQRCSYVSADKKEVTFPGDYAHYLYIGKKMVSKIPGNGPFLAHDENGNEIGLRYKKGTKLKYAEPEQKLSFNLTFNPNAQEEWFEAAKKSDLEIWRRVVANEMTKR